MSLYPVLRVAPAVALVALQIQPALAGGSSRRPQQRPALLQREQPSQESRDAGSDIETEDLFGFTVGSDIGNLGEMEGSTESIGRFGRRGGHYRVFSPTFEVAVAAPELNRQGFPLS